MIEGLTAAEELVRSVRADIGAVRGVAIEGPGGTGKSAVMEMLSASFEDAGITVIDGAAPTPADGGAMFVDDAHLADPAVIARMRQHVEAPDLALVFAHRPAPRRADLIDLADAVGRDGRLLRLGHLDRDGVRRRAAAWLVAPPSEAVVDHLLIEAGGLPSLIDAVAATWSDRRVADPRPEVPHDVIDRVRQLVDGLETRVGAVLHGLAIGCDLDPPTLASVLGLDETTAATAIAEARATGLLLPDGRVIPVVAAAVLAAAAPQRTTELRTRLLRLQHLAGRDTSELATTLVRAGQRDRLLVEVLTSDADRLRAGDPATALERYTDAIEAGAEAGPLAVRRAETAARAGQFRRALQLIDPVLADPDGTDFGVGLKIAATAMANGGQLARAGELYRWWDPQRLGQGRSTAVYALVATGAREHASRATDREAPARTLAGRMRALMAHGLLASLDDDAPGAMASLHQAIAVSEAADEPPMAPDTPTALAALLAIHMGDLDVAEPILRRAVDGEVDGRTAADAARPRHQLLFGWVMMLRGRYSWAERLARDVAEAEQVADRTLRDELFVAALRLGLARRTSDAPALVAAWNQGREVLLRHPVDLFSLLPLGEFAVAAARLQEFDRLRAHLADAWTLLDALDQPVIWAPALHWYAVQAAILRNRPDEVEPHAAALVRAAARSQYAAALAAGGRAWMQILADDIAPGRVERAARGLEAIGLGWDGSRLLGQAAARSGDRQASAALLQAARALNVPDEPVIEPQVGPTPTSLLSGRELEVVELLLAQRTYREIGQRLYISPKTVEHHVARIKQRIGAADRADLLARLHALVGHVNQVGEGGVGQAEHRHR